MKKHEAEYRLFCNEANKISRSVYVPGNATFLLNGKSVIIEGGIKSVDPMCTGKAQPFGSHPFTCDACDKQLSYLNDLVSKRKKASLSKDEGRVGRIGFRSTYGSKIECDKELSVMKKRNKELNKENVS